jgi:hypothetical protein
MRSSVSKGAGQGAKGQQNHVISLKNATQGNTHIYVGLDLPSDRL